MAFQLLRTDGAAVGAAVLDSPWPLNRSGLRWNAGGLDRRATSYAELGRLLDACVASTACRPTLPAPRAALGRITRRFDSTPLATSATGPDGRRHALQVTGAELRSMLYREAGATETLAGLPLLVRRLADGDRRARAPLGGGLLAHGAR